MSGATAILFPGQGSQAIHMGQSLCEHSSAARAVFATADEVLGFPISRLCFEGAEPELTDTINAQPAIFTTSYACWKALQESPRQVQPAFMAGHSLGEYTALAAAGCFSFAEGLRLVRLRGIAMKAAGEQATGGMAAILKLATDAIAALCREAQNLVGGTVGIANDNCPGQIVISGDRETLGRAMELARGQGARVMPLAVSVGAHSRLMAPATAAMADALSVLQLNRPSVPVVGNVSARPLADPGQVREELVAQLTSPVRWTESVQFMSAQGVGEFAEIGPGKVLTGLVRRIVPEAQVWNVGEWADLPAV